MRGERPWLSPVPTAMNPLVAEGGIKITIEFAQVNLPYFYIAETRKKRQLPAI